MTRLWVSCLLASTASVVHLRAALYGPLALRRNHIVVSVLAALYAGAYVALIHGLRFPFLDGTDRAKWSETLSWIGFGAWILVWIVPAWRVTAHERRQVAEANRAIEAHSDVPEQS